MKIVLIEPKSRSPLRTARPQEHVQMSKSEALGLLKEIHGMEELLPRYTKRPYIQKLAKLMKIDMDAPLPFEGN